MNLPGINRKPRTPMGDLRTPDARLLLSCPICLATPFEPFMRGLVRRHPRKWLIGPKRNYCAVICRNCKQTVGYETPMLLESFPDPPLWLSTKI